LWKQEPLGVGTVSVISKVMSGGRVEGRVVDRQENIVLGRSKNLVERRSTIMDKGLPCKSFFLFYVWSFYWKYLVPNSCMLCVCVCSWAWFLNLRLWLVYQKQDNKVVNRKGSWCWDQTRQEEVNYIQRKRKEKKKINF